MLPSPSLRHALPHTEAAYAAAYQYVFTALQGTKVCSASALCYNAFAFFGLTNPAASAKGGI